jgi:hypothetical protein
MFGIKALPDFERDNGEGKPYHWFNNNWHDITIEGISEEAISYDSGGGDAGAATRDSDTVASKDATHDKVYLASSAWSGNSTYNQGGYYIEFVTGNNAGEYAQIYTQSSDEFKLVNLSANFNWANVSVGDEVSIGIVMDHNIISNNTVVAASSYPGSTGTRVAYSFGGNQLYSQIINNEVQGQPDAYFSSIFNFQDANGDGTADPQAITVRSITNNQSTGSVTGNNRFYPSMNNCISGNTIENGDITASWVNFGSPSFISGNYISNNTYTNSGNTYRTYQTPLTGCPIN